MTELQKKLYTLSDSKYKDFNAKLIPNVESDKIIGVRTPKLREIAKELFRSGNYQIFLHSLPHESFEENQIHGFLIEQIKDFDECITELNKFLPFVNNWATCDQCTPKVFKKNTEKLLSIIKKWIKVTPDKKSEYQIRFGIRMIMCFYLDENFKSEYLQLVADIKSDLYYINMMTAWFFATALAKHWEETLPFIKDKSILTDWVRRKTIQKACESFRVSDEHKQILRSL
ncbi:DNA alkylation repair protein [Treponema sp.]|uniref:DNA alkylation repair protein n=1 Tax=Treponema sp. TaxID=166 RepID=UPI00388ED2E5